MIPFVYLYLLFGSLGYFTHCEELPNSEAPPNEPPVVSAGPPVLLTETIEISSPDQILSLEDSFVRPVLYKNIACLKQLPAGRGKEKFIAAVLPAILITRHRIEERRNKLIKMSQTQQWSAEDSLFFCQLSGTYRTEDLQTLIARMKPHPNSIVLVQAAIETGWGSSRFFQQANNLFGIWSFDPREPRIAAHHPRGKTTIYLRRYGNISESILDYFHTIGRSRPYRSFQKARAETEDPYKLLPYLKHYSEKKEKYVAQLRAIIDQNNLTRYDHYRLDPCFFVPQEISSAGLSPTPRIAAGLAGE